MLLRVEHYGDNEIDRLIVDGVAQARYGHSIVLDDLIPILEGLGVTVEIVDYPDDWPEPRHRHGGEGANPATPAGVHYRTSSR